MFSLLCLLLAATSAVGTRAFIAYATGAQLFDIPNARSSHAVPVPRGGGLVFSVLTLIGLATWGAIASGEERLPVAVFLAAGAMLVLGFLDDRLSLPAVLRLACQLLLAAVVVLSLDPIPTLTLFAGARIDSESILAVLLLVGLVWLVNLYNFMDGIDALAAGEALFVAMFGALLCWQQGESDVAAWLLLLASCLTGFLVWNLPPAKVFMGDAGSVFLGFFFGAVALLSHSRGGPEVWVWLILLGAFCVDTTVTLLQRLRFGQRPLEAHRTHAYQYLSRRWGGHGRVTAGLMALNVLWLAPWAIAATRWPDYGFSFMLVAYVPLAIAAVAANAGVPDRSVYS